MRILLVVNPVSRGATSEARRLMRARLAALDGELEEIETRGDGDDEARIRDASFTRSTDVVVAAGGDGTHRVAAAALLRATPEAPDLVPVPLGTANNFARSLGFARAVASRDALERAVTAAVSGTRRRLDVGRVDGRVFLGSFALGIDGEILATRNRHRGRLKGVFDGYPLYLAACAANLARHRGIPGELQLDGKVEATRVYNLLVTNVPIYAGEFRFDSSNGRGALSLHLFGGAGDYLSRYTLAWPRHFLGSLGDAIPASPGRSFRRLVVDCAKPSRAQIDGENLGTARHFELSVEPGALPVRVPGSGSTDG